MGPILSATDFDDVLGAMAEGVIDAILIQDAVPELDAVELCRKIRTSSKSPNARVPIVLICTDLSLQRTVEVSNAGANEVLLYPFHKSKLVHRLSAAFHDRRPFVEHEDYVGPDRRTLRTSNHCGDTRRVDDPQTQDQPVAERVETAESSAAQTVIEPAAEDSIVGSL